MGSVLRLFVEHKAVGVTDKWPVVGVEENVVWDLLRSGWEEGWTTLILSQFSFVCMDEFTEG